MTNNLHQIQMGIGTWAWGDTLYWSFGRGYTEHDLQAAFETIANTPNILIDTAEVYGMGKSESYVGQFTQAQTVDAANRPLIATKFFPFPWRLSGEALKNALKRSLTRLQTAQVDLYQVHWPLPPVSINIWMRAMAEAHEIGYTRDIGVSNYNSSQTEMAAQALQQFNLSLATNQVKYSLLDRRIEQDGLLDTCQQLGVRVIAYSPLEQGLLTGKYSVNNPPKGFRSARSKQKLELIQPLINTMRDIGKAYADNGVVKTPAQIALNWCIAKGTMPIPGAKNAHQAQQNLGALGWKLNREEVAILDQISQDVNQKLYH